jgi:hypothetical protein
VFDERRNAVFVFTSDCSLFEGMSPWSQKGEVNATHDERDAEKIPNRRALINSRSPLEADSQLFPLRTFRFRNPLYDSIAFLNFVRQSESRVS